VSYGKVTPSKKKMKPMKRKPKSVKMAAVKKAKKMGLTYKPLARLKDIYK